MSITIPPGGEPKPNGNTAGDPDGNKSCALLALKLKLNGMELPLKVVIRGPLLNAGICASTLSMAVNNTAAVSNRIDFVLLRHDARKIPGFVNMFFIRIGLSFVEFIMMLLVFFIFSLLNMYNGYGEIIISLPVNKFNCDCKCALTHYVSSR